MSEWVEILWGFTKFYFKQMLKVSVFHLKKQKSFIPKKLFFSPLSISKQKSFVYWPNFQWRFWQGPHEPKLVVKKKGSGLLSIRSVYSSLEPSWPWLSVLYVRQLSLRRVRHLVKLKRSVNIVISWVTDYGHTMAKSLILCGTNSNSNPNPKSIFGIWI